MGCEWLVSRVCLYVDCTDGRGWEVWGWVANALDRICIVRRSLISMLQCAGYVLYRALVEYVVFMVFP